MTNAPLVSWYESLNTKASEVKSVVNFGTVDADSASPTKTFYIWNNRAGDTDCSKMEDVTFTTRDRQGGLGDTLGQEVEAVRDNWFHVRVDSLGETSFLPVGRGGVAVNNSGVKDLGTNGTTTNVNAKNAVVWSVNTAYNTSQYLQPSTANGFIYKVVTSGISDGVEPAWKTVEGDIVVDGTCEYEAFRIENKPSAKEILGLANDTNDDGSNAQLAGGNFVQVSVYAEVPISASSGVNKLMQRVSYKFV